jgi:hypothetical protein
MRRFVRSASLVTAMIAVLVAAALALAAPLTPTGDPLAGSDFQGADGNQASEGALIDWDALHDAGRVVHNPDANALDTAFAGGTKEGDPNQWALTTEEGGVTPGKANIHDAWSAVDQPGGTTFLYLAFTRGASTGDTFLTFELNQDERLWRNKAGEHIPCRTEGDILVSYEISGNSAEVFLRRWHTLTTDPDTGCARTGDVEAFTTVRADFEAQGAINAGQIPNVLPGFYGDAIPAVRFGEAALNLDKLLGQAFPGGCYAFGSMWMHSRASTSYSSQMQDYVAPQSIDLRTCSAAGTKFFDLDADGKRDPAEPGIPGFEIYADYNRNGELDPGEPSTVSDASGHYVLSDIRPPSGREYILRERLVQTRRRATNDWICSFPNAGTDGGFGRVSNGLRCGWGPIDVDEEPNAEHRDFGNWYPAQLTVAKELEPTSDAGRFDLLVNGEVVVPNAQDGSSVTLNVPPGLYTITEQPASGTDPDLYDSTVGCKLLTRRRHVRSGTVFEDVALAAGGRASCTFRNIRTGFPAIAIDKSGPAIAEAGDTLHYTLRVTNPGRVSFPADRVKVSDPACDHPPELVDTSDGSGPDGTPKSLDPGDLWTYSCSRKTDEPGKDCALSVVRNTATAEGTAGGSTVEDSSTIVTALTCPDVPPPDPPDPEPEPPEPIHPVVPPQPPDPGPLTPVVPDQPRHPSAVVPPVPRPPKAGTGGVAGLVRSRLGRCVERVPRLRLRGARIGRLVVRVDGRVVQRLRSGPLQRRLTIRRHRGLDPGRHRVTVRVTFRLGSGTPPVTLTRRLTICRPVLPRFTG